MAEDQQIPTKRGRGPTQLSWLDDLPPGGTLKIEVDKYKQPIGSNSTYLSSYIGYLARDVNRFPLSITDWKKMVKFREEEINKAIDQIKQIFEIPFECNKFLSERLNARWKDHKCTVKKEHFSSYDNLDECLANPPDGIEPSEWMNVVDYWNSEDAKKQSRQNAKNKALQQIPHTGGSKSHAKYADELRKELNASPPRTTVYKRTHTRKRNLAPVNELAAEKIDKMEKLQHQMTQEDGEFVDSGPNDIFAQVMGRDRGGRVRCYGPVKPKQFWDRDTLNSRKKRRSDDVEKNQQIKDLQDQLKSALERLEQLENDRSGGSNAQKVWALKLFNQKI